MTYPQELQAYYDAHDFMMDEERRSYLPHPAWWAQDYGLYKIARYSAVKAGYLPEQPEFG